MVSVLILLAGCGGFAGAPQETGSTESPGLAYSSTGPACLGTLSGEDDSGVSLTERNGSTALRFDVTVNHTRTEWVDLRLNRTGPDSYRLIAETRKRPRSTAATASRRDGAEALGPRSCSVGTSLSGSAWLSDDSTLTVVADGEKVRTFSETGNHSLPEPLTD